jgi:hypothetical protein
MTDEDKELEQLVDRLLAEELFHVIDGPGAFSGDWTETWDTPPWNRRHARMRREICQRLLRERAKARAAPPRRK